MKISFALLCHNETDSLHALLAQLNDYKEYDYEIIVVYDKGEDDTGYVPTNDILNSWQNGLLHTYSRPLNNDYAAQKNFMTEKCSGDFIINPDADELFPDYILENIHLIIEENDTECLWLPRINIVEGMTADFIKHYGWNINEKGYVNWPDYQARIYKNNKKIKWKYAVHEQLTGFSTYSYLPAELDMSEHFAIKHIKSIGRQVEQNLKYKEIKLDEMTNSWLNNVSTNLRDEKNVKEIIENTLLLDFAKKFNVSIPYMKDYFEKYAKMKHKEHSYKELSEEQKIVIKYLSNINK